MRRRAGGPAAPVHDVGKNIEQLGGRAAKSVRGEEPRGEEPRGEERALVARGKHEDLDS